MRQRRIKRHSEEVRQMAIKRFSSCADRRRANLGQAIAAAYDQIVANYRETVLTGFQQVEDNVAALRILEKEAQVQNVSCTTGANSVEALCAAGEKNGRPSRSQR